MGKYEETASMNLSFQGSHREMMEVFSKIITGCATQQERERYLAMWECEMAVGGEDNMQTMQLV